MSTIKVVYWSGSGNTRAMAEEVAKGITEGGKNPEVVEVSEITIDVVKEESVLALGCPSMGVEELEEEYMEPFICELEPYVKGKQLVLFGSYGWGDCEWMRNWEDRMVEAGATLVAEGITVLGEADADVNGQLQESGRQLATLA